MCYRKSDLFINRRDHQRNEKERSNKFGTKIEEKLLSYLPCSSETKNSKKLFSQDTKCVEKANPF